MRESRPLRAPRTPRTIAPERNGRHVAPQDGSVPELVESYKAGRVSRRGFVRILTGAGVSVPIVASILAACGRGSEKGSTDEAGDSLPQTEDAFLPTQRGGGGALRLFWWRMPSTLNPHLSSSAKDRDGSSIFYERLAAFDAEASLVPNLAAEVPAQDKGTLDKALTFVIWKLKKGVTWHDGMPFTAEDVVFTYQYVTDTETAALSAGEYKNIASVEKLDDYTVRVNFKEATLDWSTPWTSSAGLIIPKHLFHPYKGKEARNAPANLKPVGTGPYVFVEFWPNELVQAEINQTYHVEHRPFFDTLEMRGGGDALGAAQAVLQAGQYDFAWNLQVPGPQLDEIEQSGGHGHVNVVHGGNLEHVLLNYADPNKDVDGERSSLKAPHPFFTDLRVRRAFALAIDRKRIVEQLYGKTGEVALLYACTPQKYTPTVTWQKDSAAANQLLDEAGWRKGGDGIRTKDGVRMKVLFQSSISQLRQDTQALIEQNLREIGVECELKSVIADVFFTVDPANTENVPHFYADMQMYTATRSSPDDVLTFLQAFLSTAVRQKANNWSLQNTTRYQSKEFDALYATAKAELDPVRAAAAVKKLQQKLLDDVAVVPLVARGTVSASKKDLRGMSLSGWASDLWRLAYWYREV